MQQAKRHGINVTPIPTARQLLLQTGKKKITKSQVKTLSTQKKSLQTIVKSQPKTKQSHIKVQTLKPPKPLRKKTSGSTHKKPNYSAINKQHQTKFVKISKEGLFIDKLNGNVIGPTTVTDEEDIGKYIYDNYADKETGNINLPVQYQKSEFTDVYELQTFMQFISSKIQQATDDLNDSSKHASLQGIREVSEAFKKLSEDEWKEAFKKYDLLGDEVKSYLDEALYYTGSGMENHYRAIKIVCDILELPFSDLSKELIIEMEDTGFGEDIIMELDEQRAQGRRYAGSTSWFDML